MADRSVKVTLTAQVNQYIEGMEKASKSTREVGSEAEKLSQQREAFEQVGRGAMVAGAGIAAGLALATKAAIDWDTAWAGVTKTVDGSPEELAKVEEGLRGLAAILPASHTEIAAVAEAAGQLGIETPNVVAFTKTMIDLGETTNLSSEQAAMSLARFMNIMGTSQGQVSNLGASLVGLGNNFATTESEILEMSTRLAKSGVQVGLSEGEVLGLATALSSVGIEAEAGGSAMSKVMIDIAASVEQGGDRLELFAQTAGMSADQFAQKWKSAPAEALAAFVTGLSNAEKQGGSTLGVLSELGITEVRMRDALLGSAAAADQFSEAMEMGNEEFEKNTALTAEAEKRYETTAAKLGMMRNQVVDAAIDLGQQFLPALEAGAEMVGGLADWLSEIPGPAKFAVAWIGAVSAAVLLGGGFFLAAVPKIAAYRAALETLGETAKRTDRILSTVGKAAGLIGLAMIVGEAGAALADWRAKAAGTSKTADELAKSFSATSTSAKAMTEALSANNVLKDFGADASAVSNMKALNTTFGDLMAKFEGTAFGKVTTFINSFGTGGQLGRAKENIQEIDAALSQMVASGDTEAAAAAYEQFAAMAEDAGWSAQKIADALPEYTNAVEESVPPTETAADRAKDAASAYTDQADAARAATDELFKLVDALMESNNVAQTAESANARYQKTVADVAEYLAKAQEGVEGYSRSLDENTVEGSSNREMLAGMAADSQAAANAIYEQELATIGNEQATANWHQRLADGRQAIYDTILGLTGNAEAAQVLTDKIYQIPTQPEIDVVANTSQATGKIAQLKDLIAGIQRNIEISINAVTTATTAGSANGNMFAYANGGIAAYANGGFPTGIYSGGAPIHKFAEPETGWEAYISGKPSERDRNRQIWMDAGERLGMGDVMKAIAAAGQRGPTTVNQSNQIQMVEKDPRLTMRQLGREIKGALT